MCCLVCLLCYWLLVSCVYVLCVSLCCGLCVVCVVRVGLCCFVFVVCDVGVLCLCVVCVVRGVDVCLCLYCVVVLRLRCRLCCGVLFGCVVLFVDLLLRVGAAALLCCCVWMWVDGVLLPVG